VGEREEDGTLVGGAMKYIGNELVRLFAR